MSKELVILSEAKNPIAARTASGLKRNFKHCQENALQAR
jgi:hypothetical protein